MKRIISILVLLFCFSSLVFAQTKPSEKYLFELRDYVQKIDEETNATSKDWLAYLNKIYPVQISFPSNMTEEQKESYLKSIVLATLYSKYGFGHQNRNVQKIVIRTCNKISDVDPQAPPSAQGGSHLVNGVMYIDCLNNRESAEIVHVMLHEFIHKFEGIGQENEPAVHSKLRRNLPILFRGSAGPDNYPARFDLFKSQPAQSRLEPVEKPTQIETFTITPAAYKKDRNFDAKDNLHETVHGVNGMGGRIQIDRGKGNGQAIVIGLDEKGNYILTFVSELNYTIDKLALPAFLKKKGSAYEQYVINPQASKKTTYVIDEWSAYIMGTEDNIKMLESGKKQDNALTTFRVAEFMVMGAAVLNSTSKLDPVLYSNQSFQNIIKYEIERSAELIRKSYITKDANGKTPLVRSELDDVINNFINSKESEPLRNILSSAYGDEWLANIIGKLK